jgi:hypothetical protein
MKKVNVFFFILMVLTMLCITSHLSAATRGISVVSEQGQNLYLYKDYRAVVIGVSDYEQWPKLPNAVNDAIEVAEKLKRMGFIVKLVLDPTYREMKTALTGLVYKIGREHNRGVLFYYAGHGETETLADGKKMGYIIPKDCPLLARNPEGFSTHAISMREIESISLRIRSKHVLMLFDSCFSGALFSLVRAVPDDIDEKSTLPVRQYITAGKEDEVVPDQSMFKRCFLIGLNGDADLTGDGYVTGSELGMYLSDKVVNYTHRRQHPQYGKINNPDLDRGDFVFALKGSERKKTVFQVKQPIKAEMPNNPQLDMDILLKKIREQEEAKKRAKESQLQQARNLRKDLDKYKQIVNANMDKTIEIAAWHVLSNNYPEWTRNVNPGDTATLIQHVLAKDTDGSLRKIIAPTVRAAKQAHVASIGKTTVSEIAKDTAEDGRFVAYNNGTVLDTKTNLMWAGTVAGESSGYHSDGKNHCDGYRGGGHTDWRMPTLDELETIYNKKYTNEHGYHITKLIGLGGEYVWAQGGWGGAAAFNFENGFMVLGNGSYEYGRTPKAYVAWALPVRDVK